MTSVQLLNEFQSQHASSCVNITQCM